MSNLYAKSGVNLSQAEMLCKKLADLDTNFSDFTGQINLNKNIILTSCDGIGSKIIPLYEKKLYRNIALEVVAANLNDLATKNAIALAFYDYIAVHTLDSDAVFTIISELKNVLDAYNCKLLGGETSELPHLLRENAIDICGFVIGSGNNSSSNISDGDIVIALKSSGVHANGFSLIRKFYCDGKLSESDFEKCLEPTYIYYEYIRKLWENNLIKSAANITGGGLYSNIIRIIPKNFDLQLDYSKLLKSDIFKKLYDLCGAEVYQVFNCGAGFCLIADKNNFSDIFNICKEFDPIILGKVVEK